jgi:hypothetical protein
VPSSPSRCGTSAAWSARPLPKFSSLARHHPRLATCYSRRPLSATPTPPTPRQRRSTPGSTPTAAPRPTPRAAWSTSRSPTTPRQPTSAAPPLMPASAPSINATSTASDECSSLTWANTAAVAATAAATAAAAAAIAAAAAAIGCCIAVQCCVRLVFSRGYCVSQLQSMGIDELLLPAIGQLSPVAASTKKKYDDADLTKCFATLRAQVKKERKKESHRERERGERERQRERWSRHWPFFTG